MPLKRCKKTTQAGLSCKGYAGPDGLCGAHARLICAAKPAVPSTSPALDKKTFVNWLRSGIEAGYVSAEVALGIALEH